MKIIDDKIHLFNSEEKPERSVKPKKRFGQNFLVNERILSAIADECGKSPEVVEIGCGTGNLTKKLLEKGIKVTGIEFDRNLEVDLLKLEGANFTLEMADATNMEYHQDKVYVGNLPYNVGSRILLKCVKSQVKRMVFLLQKEVVDKICAQPGTGDYSSLSVLIQTYYNCKAKLLVGPENFRPKPKVNSKLLVCERRLDCIFPDYDIISSILRKCFFSSRKTLRNNIGQSELLSITTVMELDLNKRPGQIQVEKYVELALIKERVALNK